MPSELKLLRLAGLKNQQNKKDIYVSETLVVVVGLNIFKVQQLTKRSVLFVSYMYIEFKITILSLNLKHQKHFEFHLN